MTGRREFLKALAVLALAAALPAAFFARRFPPVRRHGNVYLVNGWVLTARDLEAIKRHVA